MDSRESRLAPHITPAGAWALAMGTSIGWGSLVITSNTYLSQAGPLGSTLGMIAGALIMLLIAANYVYLINCYPEAGGAYAYARDSFGYDFGFLTAWFLMLTYLAMFWANATALPLFVRVFFGDILRVGRLYTLFGYDVYLGEALLSAAAIALTALLCMRSGRGPVRLMVAFVSLFTVGITVCFAAAMLKKTVPLTPRFVPEKGALSQIVRIACISPWAFIGFECISHGAEEFTFRRSRLRRIFAVSVCLITLLYVFVTLLSVTAYPPEYDSWLAYIRDLGSQDGLRGLPAFYAAERYLGGFGVVLLTASLFALVATSLIGNLFALSRLFYALARDDIFPVRYAELNVRRVPAGAVALAAGISALIPFVGRTAIGWIVDVTTIGATLIYGIVSAAALKMARTRGDAAQKWTGGLGALVMAAFGAYLLIPNLFTEGSIETESYFLFIVWAVLGFLFFRRVLKKDRSRRFGKSVVVWVALLSLVLFVSLVWMSRSVMDATARAMGNLQASYAAAGFAGDQSAVIAREISGIRFSNARSILVIVGIMALSLGVLFNNYSLMSRRAQESETQLGLVRDLANRDPLTGVKSKHAYAEKEKQVDGEIASGLPPFAVAVCDVNGLKHVNDTLGHKAGDAYIRAASAMICEIFKHSPVYRIGGDEFAVYLTGRDYERRTELMQQLHDRSAANIAGGEVVVAGGLSDFRPGEDRDIHTVFARADGRMYEEKAALKALGARTR